MKLKSERWLASICALVGSILFATAGVGQTKPEPPKPTFQRFGQVSIAFGVVEILSQRGKNAKLLLTFNCGPNGAKEAQLKSRRYDMAAPKISLSIQDSLVQTGTATGGVRVQVRDIEQDRITDARGDTATYTAANRGEPARLVVSGNVRGVVRSPELSPSDPLNIQGSSMVVEFLDSNTTRITMENGTTTATPLEPAPTKKKN